MLLQNLQSELAESIQADDKNNLLITPAANLHIYHNNLQTTLIQTLKDIYPLVVKLVGDDFFTITAKEYSRQYPSRSSNLNEYGEYFRDFLAVYPPVRDLIYLAEVAQFEWASHVVFYAADHAGLDIELIKNVTPDHYHELHFSLHPASQLIKFHFPILRIIDLCQGEIDSNIDITAGGVNLLIIRRDHNIALVELNTADFTFLNALQEHKSLAEALDAVIPIDANFALETKLPQWISNKTIVDCYLLK